MPSQHSCERGIRIRTLSRPWLNSQITESALERIRPVKAGSWEIAYVLAALEAPGGSTGTYPKDHPVCPEQWTDAYADSGEDSPGACGPPAPGPDEALELAEPEGYFSSFIDEGKPMQNLLNHLSNQSQSLPKPVGVCRKIAVRFEAAPPKPSSLKGWSSRFPSVKWKSCSICPKAYPIRKSPGVCIFRPIL